MAVTDVVPQVTEGCGEDDLADLSGNLVTNHVKGGRSLSIKVKREVTEEAEGEAGRFWGVEQLDAGDAEWVSDQATAPQSE